jgi:hypothetical protein
MRYEELVVRWFLSKIGKKGLASKIDWSNPPQVTFEAKEGFVYSEYTADSDYVAMECYIAGKYYEYEFVYGKTDIAKILKEIMEFRDEALKTQGVPGQ